jgi:hypothetical protein
MRAAGTLGDIATQKAHERNIEINPAVSLGIVSGMIATAVRK